MEAMSIQEVWALLGEKDCFIYQLRREIQGLEDEIKRLKNLKHDDVQALEEILASVRTHLDHEPAAGGTHKVVGCIILVMNEINAMIAKRRENG